MTRILAIADAHVGAAHITDSREQEAALDAVVALCASERVELLLIAGDLFHFNRPSPEAIQVVGRFFERLRIPAVMALGNHDPDSGQIARYFRGHVVVPSIPARIQSVVGVDVAVMPFLVDRFVRARLDGNATKEQVAHALTTAASEILRGFLAQRRPGIPMVLLAHGTVAGTETSSGFSMGFTGGTEWRISVEDASEFDLSVVGHIHRFQTPAANVVVPGSLLPLDFSEVAPHGVIVADVYANAMTTWRFVDIPGPDVSTWDVPGPDLANLINNQREDWPVSQGEKIRVHVTCDEATAREFPPSRISKALYDAGASLVQVELEVIRADRARDDGMTSELLPGAALTRYLAGRDDLTVAQRARIADLAVEPLSEVVQGHAASGDLELHAVEAHDFLGVHDARIEFDGGGVYAITGPVGSGKSALGCDVPRFALFGASRYGAKVTDSLVRQGADVAMAAVEFTANGDLYRVVRKVKRGSRGSTSTLDVLARPNDEDGDRDGFRPLSSGKLADGTAQLDRILGGLTDETLVASSLVVQRAADAFTRARPEDRKRLLAEAAGLGIYDELAEVTRERLASADRALALLHARSEPLRARAALIPEITEQIDDAIKDVAKFAVAAQTAQRARDESEDELRRTQERAAEFERVMSEAAELQRRIDGIDAEVAEWTRKQQAATAILAERPRLLAARGALGNARAEIVVLEAQLVADSAAITARQEAIGRKEYREGRLFTLRNNRVQESRGFDYRIDEAKKKGALIEEAVCCKPEPDCVFLVDARNALTTIPEFEAKLAERAEPSAAETALIQELLEIVIPDAPDPAITKGKLTKGRARASELERDIQVAEKIARAEEVIAQHDEATRKLRAQREDLSSQKSARNRALLGFGGKPNVDRASDAKAAADLSLKGAQREEQHAVTSAAELRGRLASLTDARVELAAVEGQITQGAGDVAAWKELATAWKACRVMVLETSVIPAVEQTANEILRRFPYGMQLAFSTQRAKRDGDGVSEALDIEVLGGRAPVYEGCSGGQKTTIDFALHVAIALVVSRRSATRLRFLFADEPEGLDEDGRAAFAALARWIHETFNLTVLVASHAADLVEALGGTRIEMVASADGSTAVAA